MLKSPSEILENIVNSLNVSKYKFSKEIGLSSPDHLYKMLNGKQNPSWETLQKIVEQFPNISDRFLLRGEGEVFENGDIKNTNSKNVDTLEKVNNKKHDTAAQSESVAHIQLAERDELIKQLRDENAFLRSLIKK